MELPVIAVSGKSESLINLADDFPTPPPTPPAVAAAATATAAAAAAAAATDNNSTIAPLVAVTTTAGGFTRPLPLPPSTSTAKPPSLPPSSSQPSFRKSYPPLIEGNLPLLHPLRLPAVLLLDSIAWDAGILVLVLFNALCLTFYRPTDASTSSLSQAILFFEIFCQLCFTNEMIVKFLALGIVKYKKSYFRDPWSVFDFLVLIAGWLALYGTFFSSSSSLPSASSPTSSLPPSSSIHGPLTVFGVLRVLRPFRILNLLPELKRLTGAVILALLPLTTLMSLALLVFLTLSLVGMQLFQGKFNQQCYKSIGGYWEGSSSSGEGGEGGGGGGGSVRLCSMEGGREGGRACPAGGWVCKDVKEGGREGPNGGWTSFDSVWMSLLTIFQCMTQQGWSDVMYWGRQSGGGWVVYVFFILILILSFFLFQLIVVFVIVNYSKSQRKGGRERGNEGGREEGGMSLSQRGKVGREGGKEEGREKRVMVVSRKKSVVIPLVGEEEEGEEGREGGVLQEQLKRVKSGDYSELLISKLLAIKAGAQLEALTALPPSLPPSSSIGKGEGGREGGVNVRVGEIALLLQRAMRHLQLAPQHSLSPSSFRLKETGEDEEDDPLLLRKNGGRTRKGGRKGGEVDPSSVKYEESPGTYICAAIARSRIFYYFGHFITILSTLLLSLAHYGMSPSLSRFLTRMNNFLVLIFCLEVFVKARGWGWRRYKEEEGGVGLDLFVVVVSLLELFLGGTSSRSYALRCVRLVRIFSLGREWGGFRKVLGNVVYTASNSVPFLLLLGTFLSVFAIGGMTFLGGKLVDSDGLAALPVPARRNFDSFYWSVVSVFQIMTLDGWNSEMYKAMSVSDSAIAAGFYVSAVLLGKYGLLNLLTAILVENYGRLQEEEEEEEEEGEGGREGGLTLSTGPGGVPSHCHWKQVVFYLPPSHPHARNLKAGERVRIAGAYDRDRLRVQVVGKEDG